MHKQGIQHAVASEGGTAWQQCQQRIPAGELGAGSPVRVGRGRGLGAARLALRLAPAALGRCLGRCKPGRGGMRGMRGSVGARIHRQAGTQAGTNLDLEGPHCGWTPAAKRRSRCQLSTPLKGCPHGRGRASTPLPRTPRGCDGSLPGAHLRSRKLSRLSMLRAPSCTCCCSGSSDAQCSATCARGAGCRDQLLCPPSDRVWQAPAALAGRAQSSSVR